MPLGMPSSPPKQPAPAAGAPLYRRLADELRAEILAGKVRPGERLPAERGLVAQHGLSLNTVRQALNVLAQAGLVERRHGAGTYVLDPRRQRRRALVGVMVPSVTSFFGEVLHGIEDELRAAGHRLVLFKSGYDAAAEQRYLHDLDTSGLDGLLLAPSLHGLSEGARDAYLALLRRVRRQAPSVFVERRLPDDDAEFASSDPVAGAALAVRHLYALGRRRIAFVGPTRTAPAEPIFAGYRKALADLGLTEGPARVLRHRDWGRRGDEDAAAVRTLLAHPEPPDSILCMGDEYAFRVYYVLRQAGLRVPEDVSLVAYDDVVAHLLEVPLTAVAPPKYEVGRQAAALLARRLARGPEAPVQQVLLKPRLVVRGTCGGVPEPGAMHAAQGDGAVSRATPAEPALAG